MHGPLNVKKVQYIVKSVEPYKILCLYYTDLNDKKCKQCTSFKLLVI
jgi:hypothetical protein